jgi:hypothetical protein
VNAFIEGFKKSPVALSLIGAFALACVGIAVVDAIQNPVNDSSPQQKTTCAPVSTAPQSPSACKN